MLCCAVPCKSFTYDSKLRAAQDELDEDQADLDELNKQLEEREVDLTMAKKDLQEREAAVKHAQDTLQAQQVSSAHRTLAICSVLRFTASAAGLGGR
jgi:chromosome segregation ATPase